ncbi:hypothetical protein IED13_09650 [Bosea sp. SSUT16]|uniref:GcrA cell cycle regulator n=1 Tax=Bosea spartocytisi TaxID=2773451 RepID=A0A927E715_9HYPH|nr:GcrA family cell cycle regulator [Bosea spartocytisi]MBD3845961.1 hypothetical protein [Bosea spartocytisi]MCT4473145.1 GcrA family cell cycle regulator [Bosea spartocytisi]
MTEAVFIWSEATVARLKAMVEDGGSASDISNILGCSRNSVIGKVHRLGLAFARGWGQHETPAAKQKRDRAIAVKAPPRILAKAPAPKPKPKAPPAPEVDPTPKRWPKPEGPEAVDITALRAGLCHMPLWSDLRKGGLYCGKPVAIEGLSWCDACRQLVYEARPIRSQEEAQARAQRQVRQLARSGAFA